MMPGPKPIHSDAVFIRAWLACESVPQLARRLGLSQASVKARARVLRASGVTLPRQRVCP
jgi:biotin operon repressor